MLLINLLLLGTVVHSGVKAYKKINKINSQDVLDTELPAKSEKTPSTEHVEPKDLRHQQMEEISSNTAQDEIDEFDKKNTQYLSASAVGLGLATSGALFFHPLSLLSVPILFYVSTPIFQESYVGIIEEKKLNVAVIDSISIIGGIFTEYYFISALSNVTYYLAKGILSKTRDTTKKNLINVFSEQPRLVWLLKDGIEIEVSLDEIKVGDIIVVNAGGIIPVDGVITEGMATIDQHALTGEFQPCEKTTNEQVLAATVVLAGCIHIQVEKTGVETIAVQIGEILNNTAEFELVLQTQGEQVADKTVIPTIATGTLAFLTLGTYSSIAIFGSNFSEIIRLTSPFSMLNFLTIASKNNILIKDGRSLELLNKVDTVIFDKTGTLTLEQPYVGNIYTCNGIPEQELLSYAAAAEYRQSHPIAKAILQAAVDLDIPDIDESQYEIGYGIKIKVNNKLIKVGSIRFMEMEQIDIPTEIKNLQTNSHIQGNTTIFVAIDEQLGGMLELCPTIRPEAKRIIKQLKQRDLSVYIISGDHDLPTKQLAEDLEIDNYFANVLPQDKAKLVEQLQQDGKSVCFVGDGINDSIALKMSTVSISLRGASAAATDIAQIIFMDQTIQQLDFLFELSQEFKSNINTGLAGTALSASLCIGGIFFLQFGIPASIMFYNATAIGGMGNALLPLLNHKNDSEKL
ncbi:heavy metal translocating P-type ATPase [Candidatus Halobeggiatoa sp. HSG11]|nr:heavy metal translocating P-type ATPase [Candidatus Halobeggiatoa sp. HSG11]